MRLLPDLLNDEQGFVISAELVIISTVLVLGLITGLKCIQVALVGEMKDVGAAIGSLNQSYSYSGFSKRTGECGCVKAFTRGSMFIDSRDETTLVTADLAVPCLTTDLAPCAVPPETIGCDCGALVDDAGQVADLLDTRIDSHGDCYSADETLLGRVVLAIDTQDRVVPLAGTRLDERGLLLTGDDRPPVTLATLIDACGNVIALRRPGTADWECVSLGTLGVTTDHSGRTVDFRDTRINAQGILHSQRGTVIGSLGSVASADGTTSASRGMLLTDEGDVIDLRGAAIDCQGTIFGPEGRLIGSLGIVVDDAGNVVASLGIVLPADASHSTPSGKPAGMPSFLRQARGVLIADDGSTSPFSITFVEAIGETGDPQQATPSPTPALPIPATDPAPE